jgi:hypothetical protein
VTRESEIFLAANNNNANTLSKHCEWKEDAIVWLIKVLNKVLTVLNNLKMKLTRKNSRSLAVFVESLSSHGFKSLEITRDQLCYAFQASFYSLLCEKAQITVPSQLSDWPEVGLSVKPF